MTSLQIQRASEIEQLHNEIVDHVRISVSKAIRIGELLTEQKAELRHGRWLRWLEENVPFGRKTADRYRRLYKYREKMVNVTNLTEAYRAIGLLADPCGERGTQREITIDEEFAQLLPELTENECRLLEESVLAHGIQSPLVVWAEKGLLMDGHQRYRLAQKHGLQFDTVELRFGCRAEARIWIRNNQLARCNLTPYHKAELVLENRNE